MGLIKNVFGGIFSFIGSLLGVVTKLFGVGKKSEFFLEIDESEVVAVANAPTPAKAAPKADSESTPAASESAVPTQAFSPSLNPDMPLVTARPLSEIPTDKPEMTFATDFLVNASPVKTQRRPGPSLSPFKDMAKEMNRKASVG